MRRWLNAQPVRADAFSPLLFNIALIGVMMALLGWRQDARDAALMIAAMVGIAAWSQLLILVWRRDAAASQHPLRMRSMRRCAASRQGQSRA